MESICGHNSVIRLATVLVAAVGLTGCLIEDDLEAPSVSESGMNSVGGVNGAPVISGDPPTVVTQGNAYGFTPDADDPDDDALVFEVINLPPWANFDSATGRIYGTPTEADVGTYYDILVSVSDGTASALLDPFPITVEAYSAGAVTLSWNPPTENTDGTPIIDLAGYKIYWGTTPGNYPKSVTIDNPGITTYVVDNLSSGTYEFVATSFNSVGVESDYSAPAIKTVP